MAATARCHVHDEMPAHGACSMCKLEFCRDCLAGVRGKRLLCVTCAAQRRSARVRKVVAGGIALAALAAVGIPLAMSELEQEPAAEPVAAADAGFDYGNRWIIVRDLLEAYEADPCNRRLAERLAKEMNRAGNFRGVVRMTHRFLSECGPHMDLLWATIYAHEQRQEWQEAADLATLLIEDAPHDSDFWWWRGKHYRRLGRYAEAEADLRQSMAVRPNVFAAQQLYELAQVSLAPCPAAFGLHRAMAAAPRGDQHAPQMRAEMYQKGSCANLEGRGRARLRRDPRAAVTTVKVRVNGERGSFILDPHVGYTSLTRAFAEQAGVEPGSDEVTVYAGGEHRPAALGEAAEVEVGKARAERVAVAVVDELPDEADGILGLSFLWRFAIRDGYDAVELSRLPR